MIQIDKNVEIPKSERKPYKKRESKYPFKIMEVGDSFVVPEWMNFLNLRQAIMRRKKTTPNEKYKTRQTKEGRRVWRIA